MCCSIYLEIATDLRLAGVTRAATAGTAHTTAEVTSET